MKLPAAVRRFFLRLNPILGAAPATSAAANLGELSNGETGLIAGLHLSAPACRRLLDLGFLPGTPLRAIRRAPLGDPLQVEVRGYHISLRRREAAGIRIQAR
jgi:Fe2+ transport system protein FeoA